MYGSARPPLSNPSVHRRYFGLRQSQVLIKKCFSVGYCLLRASVFHHGCTSIHDRKPDAQFHLYTFHRQREPATGQVGLAQHGERAGDHQSWRQGEKRVWMTGGRNGNIALATKTRDVLFSHASRALPTRLICGHTLDPAAEKCSTALPPKWSSSCSLASSELFCWRDYVSHCTSQKLGASAAQGSTERDATGQHVPDRVG